MAVRSMAADRKRVKKTQEELKFCSPALENLNKVHKF